MADPSESVPDTPKASGLVVPGSQKRPSSASQKHFKNREGSFIVLPGQSDDDIDRSKLKLSEDDLRQRLTTDDPQRLLSQSQTGEKDLILLLLLLMLLIFVVAVFVVVVVVVVVVCFCCCFCC
jgi:hypothetical protein